MAKPELFPMGTINPVTFQKYERYLPTAFDESLSLLEKVNKIIHYMNEIGEITNEMLTRWNEVYEWAMNEGLTNAVIDKINDLMENGGLMDLIDEAYGGMLDDFTHGFFMQNAPSVIKTDYPDNGYYTVTYIPFVDERGKAVIPKKVSPSGGATVREMAIDTKASIAINASIFDTTTITPKGIQIKDGVVTQNTSSSTSHTLTFNKNTKTWYSYPPSITGDELIALGVTDAWTGFYPIIKDGTLVNSDVWAQTANSSVANPRQVIGQVDTNGTYIFTFRGREDDHPGYTYADMVPILQSYGLKFAYVLDGGGSTSLVKDGLLLNPPIDGNYRDERKVPDAIVWCKDTSQDFPDEYKILGNLSAIIQKLDARTISKYGDQVPGRLVFNDFQYILNDKALYSRSSDGATSKRMLGLYDDSNLYLGNETDNLRLQSASNINVTLGNDSATNYRISLDNTSNWTQATLLNGWTHDSSRPLLYKRINSFESRLSGVVISGTSDLSGSDYPICTLPDEVKPTRQLVIPVATLSAGRQTNDIVITSSGSVYLRNPILESTSNSAIQIEVTIYRGVSA